MTAPLEIVAFEPFDGGSHRAVRVSISRHSRHHWRWLTRPDRGWKWRMRVGALELLDLADREGVWNGRCDALFTTSLMSVSDLRALLPRERRGVPLVLYMHENQAAYPVSDHPRVDAPRDVHFAMTNLTSALASDRVIFNSAWNRRSFIAGLERILRKAAAVEVGDWLERIERRSVVIWPPVEPPPVDQQPAIDVRRQQGDVGRTVVWPHRWEHDKGPEELLDLVERYTERLGLRWRLLGWQYPVCPPALERVQRDWASVIDHAGYLQDRDDYWSALVTSDWVLSTALHEYFGIAVVEALLAGCLPWLPDRLSYPELLPLVARGLDPGRPPRDPAAVRSAIAEHLQPAVAVNAVARLDEEIEATVFERGQSKSVS